MCRELDGQSAAGRVSGARGGLCAEEAGEGVVAHREDLVEEGVEGFALGVAFLELGGLGAGLFVGQFLVLGLEQVDPLDQGRAPAEEPPVVSAREELEDAVKHGAWSDR